MRDRIQDPGVTSESMMLAAPRLDRKLCLAGRKFVALYYNGRSQTDDSGWLRHFRARNNEDQSMSISSHCFDPTLHSVVFVVSDKGYCTHKFCILSGDNLNLVNAYY